MPIRKRALPIYQFFLPIFIGSFIAACDETDPKLEPPGRDKSAATEALELGAEVLQTHSPLTGMDVYLVGFHPMKEEPSHQIEAHHFCRQVNEDFAQCALFDGNTVNANLTGIEYIVSERLFNTLPVEEHKYWHPHNYEILSGQLVAPGIPEVAEHKLMKGKMNSYGKTWHVWDTLRTSEPKLPMGEPALAWSFNRDGEAKPGLVESRDQRMELNTSAKRQQRANFVELANPQHGVNELKGLFPHPSQPIPGVRNVNPKENF